ncbi:non-ribosomal peptide synthetase [Stenotrophomonas maltophilia]|uniref:Amino acid adenylation domain-containing protein n=1 Tax=Stenotrophomonas maltophilia TaxID=40324 RepID=A0A4S2D514_STEMA|nr:non-ribosomal peptide synthetase [Stenotrophomonas maltophilia]TGY36629.1 amino acid adenylation domain-containing protein [Stenotrophomonas maltophilia]
MNRTYIEQLRAKGLELAAHGDQLRISAAKGVITPALASELKERKAQILQALAEEQAAPIPLSFQQQRLWFLDELGGQDGTYNISTAFRIHGRMDVPTFQSAFATLVARHEALRTRIEVVDGEAAQIIDPGPGCGLAVHAAPTPVDERDARVAALYQQQDQVRFALRQGPLHRFELHRFAEDDHLLLTNVHHLVFDGWSSAVMVRELAALYTAGLEQRPLALPPPARQYRDFARWQRRQLQSGQWDAQLAYWTQALEGMPPLLDLPLDRPRPLQRSSRGATCPIRFGADLSQRLAAFSSRSGYSPYMIVLAALTAVLGRLSSQDDVAVGTMIANRNHGEFEHTLGFFANTLVLRTRIPAATTFADHLAATRRTVLDAFEHQDAPFERILDSLQVERTPAYTPLFQTMFVWQGAVTASLDLPGLRFEDIYRDSGQAKFDLTFTLVEEREGISGGLQYNTDLFDASTADRMVACLQHVLGQAIDAPSTVLEQIPLTPAPAALRPVASPAPAVEEGDIASRFEAMCDAHPGAIAITCGDESIAYADLDARANAVAALLAGHGIGRGDRVALFIDRSVDLIVAMLAVCKAGACYVPVDPNGPIERLRHILRDAAVAASLVGATEQAQYARVNDGNPLAPRVLDMAVSHGASRRERPRVALRAQDPAYVIYTSGSTGLPKGSVIPHGNVLRLFDATAPWFGFGPDDAWTLFHSSAFDFSVWEIWGALLHGGRLVIVPYLVSRDPHAFHALLVDQQITVLNQTPSAFLQLAEADDAAGEAQRQALALRWVVFGGEALTLPALAPWFARRHGAGPRLVNMYGITETTVHVTYREIVQDDTRQPRSLIGDPIPDLSLHLLDADLQPVPTGVLGELHVGGAGLAQCYLGQPALTAQRFVPDPFGAGGARLYRTGDLARIGNDGQLEYVGRRDAQVKLRGFRIELGEVEHAVAALPGVANALVQLRDVSDIGKRLVAYIVPDPAVALQDASALREALLARLPEHMVPTVFMPLARFPLTANGKIDVAMLPPPALAVADRRGAAAPRDAAEAALLAVWQTALGRDDIGVDDNYFALGGDSIRSIRLIAQARARGITFSVAQLFAAQTVAALARLATFDASAGPLTPTLAAFALLEVDERVALPGDVVDAYPLAALQAGMIHHSLLDPGQGHYHNVSSLAVRGCPMDAATFQAALAAVASRHPILRTSFSMDGTGRPLQRVHADVGVAFDCIDLRGSSAAAQAEAIDALIAAQKQTPFDLEQAPLYRIFIQLTAPDAFQITWVDHHAILDGWSVASFFTELFDTYFRLRRGAPVASTPLHSQYRDFVAAEGAALADPHTRAYWAGVLDSAPFLALPRTAGAGDTAATAGFRCEVALPDGHADRLRALARDAGVPLRTVLLAVHMKVLSMLGTQQDVVSGVVSNGRLEHEDGDRCLGLFLNTLPLRMSLPGGASWRQLLAGTFAAEQGLLANRRFPLSELQRMNRGEPLFEVAFNFISFHVLRQMDDALPQGFEVEQREQFQRNSFALMCGFREDPGSGVVGLDLQFDPHRLSRLDVERAGRCYRAVLEAMLACPGQAHDAAAWLDPMDRDWLQGVAEVGTLPAAPVSVDVRVQRQARLTPAVVAIEAAGVQVSYGQLDAAVSHLACQLRERGIGDGDRVAVCMQRDAGLVIALLAILRTGAAYVPMDPGYPIERLQYIARDAAPALLLATPGTDAALAACVPAVMDVTATGLLAHAATDMPAMTRHAAGLNHLIYTSGSTGVPKGVAITRGATAAMLDWAVQTFTATGLQRTLASTSICFDLSVFELFAPLSCGGCVVLVDTILDLVHTDVGALTLVNTVPSALGAILEAGRLPRVDIINVAGEPLPRPLVDKAYAHPGVQAVFNLYGPSEDTTYSTAARVPAGTGCKPSIGVPLPGTQAHVLDSALNSVPPGAIGELYLSGAGLARGYHDRAAMTAERFLPCPAGAGAGGRMYRTGDIVRFLPSGELEYLGRSDHQVKLRGFRIELGEIEHALAMLPGVQASAVLADDPADAQRRLVAYAQVDGDGVSEASLLAALRARLPEFMVPSRVVLLPALPMTPNGKIDRKALPALGVASGEAAAATAVAPPRPGTEALIAEVWSGVLGCAVDDRHAGFYALGGDSILGIQVVARMRRLGYDLTPRLLFERQTPAALAACIRRTDTQAMHCEQGPVTGTVEVSPVQHWFVDQALAHWQHWNQAVVFDVRPDLDAARLRQALGLVMAHHDMLRASLVHDGDATRQWIGTADSEPVLEVVVIDPPGSPQGDAQWLATADALQASLQPAQGRVMAGAWVHCDGGPARLLLVAHHLVVDAVSWRVLIEDLETACAAVAQGSSAVFPAKTTAYPYWTQRLLGDLRAGRWNAERSYWQSVLDTAAPALPRQRDGVNDVRSARNISVALDAGETERLLRTVPAAYQTEINDVLLLALAHALRAWTGQHSIALTLEGHGREDLFDDVDLSRTVGWFTSMYPVSLVLEHGADLAADLKAVKEQLRRIPGKGIGFGMLRHPAAGAERLPRSGAHADIGFNYLGQFDAGTPASADRWLRQADAPTGALHAPGQDRAHLLDITAAVTGRRFGVNWTYSENIHDRAAIEALADAFMVSLRAIIAHCSSPGRWGRTPSDYPLAGLDQVTLDGVLEAYPDGVEDIYPATPLQQGLIHHSLLDPDGGTYLIQMDFSLPDALDVDRLVAAWQRVLAGHAILRTAFVQLADSRLLQVVQPAPALPVQRLDWRARQNDAEAAWQQLQARDRAVGFDFAVAPLLRLHIAQMPDHAHRLLLTYHHALLDGWSIPLLLERVHAAYARAVDGQANAVPEMPGRPFRDYVQWLAERPVETAERYWRDHLEGFSQVTTILQGAASEGLGSACQRLVVSPALHAAIDALARRQGTTQSSVLQLAWARVVSRYSGRHDVVFGVTGAGRPPEMADIEASVGVFINTVPARFRLAANARVGDLLRECHAQQVQRDEHAFLPLSRIQALSDIRADTPLFESLLVFENYPVANGDGDADPTSDSLQASLLGSQERSNYPLSLCIVPTADSLVVNLNHDLARYPVSQARAMLQHFEQALQGIVDHVDAPLGRLPTLLADQAAALRQWSAAASAALPTRSLLQQHADIVARHGGRTAVVDAEGSIDHAALDARASDWCGYLLGAGVRPGDIVGVHLPRGRELVAVMLGLFKAGAVYLPLDPAQPAERLRWILQDAAPGWVVCPSAEAGAAVLAGQAVLTPDGLTGISRAGGAAGCAAPSLDAPAYIIYTSGSTGHPKGSLSTHRGLGNVAASQARAFELGVEDRLLQFAASGFDASLWEIAIALSCGGELHVVDDTGKQLGDGFDRFLQRARPTWATLPPSVLRHLQPDQFPHLRTLVSAGEACDADIVRRWSAGRQFHNAYGPSEASICATRTAVRDAAVSPGIGYPIEGTYARVLDANLDDVVPGVVGELWVGGIGLGQGYLGRPDLTAAAFRPDPAATVPGARLYRTGDLARHRADGCLTFLGRIDHQVKIRGFRVETGEVEAALLSLDAVLDAAVLVAVDGQGTPCLHACIATGSTDTPASLRDRLRQALRSTLPDYMVPARFSFLAQLPLTVNGKVDRVALAALEPAVADAPSGALASDTERTLARIWSAVIGGSVGRDSDFFDIGGNSLSAMQVIRDVRDALWQGARIEDLYRNPRLSDLARHIDTLQWLTADATAPSEATFEDLL